VSDYELDLKKRLRDASCEFVRQGPGSHEIWYSPLSVRHFTVPSRIKSKHTANAILKQAGLPKVY
jgi:hypothetical protein